MSSSSSMSFQLNGLLFKTGFATVEPFNCVGLIVRNVGHVDPRFRSQAHHKFRPTHPK